MRSLRNSRNSRHLSAYSVEEIESFLKDRDAFRVRKQLENSYEENEELEYEYDGYEDEQLYQFESQEEWENDAKEDDFYYSEQSELADDFYISD